MLERGFALCRRGLAWNMFSTLPPQHAELLYVEPVSDLLEVCRALTPWLVLRRDYAPNHFTIYLYRREHFITPGLLAVSDACTATPNSASSWPRPRSVSCRPTGLLFSN
jgi:hypothetical protein